MAFNFNKGITGNQPLVNLNQSNAVEIEVGNPPTDSISCLRFSTSSIPQIYLMAGSWDKSVKIWEITAQGEAVLRTEHLFAAPVLDCCWSQDNTKAFVACTDKAGYMWDIISNQVSQIAVHDQPIKTINYIQAPNYSCIMTGGWDKRIRFWDMKSSSPILTFDLSEKIYCADVYFPMAVVATADKKIYVFNLSDQPKEYKQIASKLNNQIRCIKIFLDKNSRQPRGFIIGSIEGRVGVQVVDDINSKENFTFKCHRDATQAIHEVFSVNDIVIHPVHQTIATIGSDGKIAYWDKEARTKLKNVEPNEKQSITAGATDAKGSILAYAFGYDWSKGHEYHDANKKPRIFIRQCDTDLTPSKK